MSSTYRGVPGNEAFASSVAISSSTNATPIEITTSSAHGLKTGDRVRIVGHTVNLAANGIWAITWVSSTKFTLDTSVGVGVGAGTGNVYPYGFSLAVTIPDDGDPATASSINVPNEANLDRVAFLAERVGAWRFKERAYVTKAGAGPGSSITASTTCSVNAWAFDSNADGAWAVRPSVYVDVNDYVEVELTGTVQVESLPTTNLALGIGFIFREHGAAFSSATIAMQDGYQQFEYSHVLGFHLKARGYLAGITRGAVLYPVLMNYGIAGATKYYLLGDLSATAKVWRAN